MRVERQKFRTTWFAGSFGLERFAARPGFHYWRGENSIGFCVLRRGFSFYWGLR